MKDFLFDVMISMAMIVIAMGWYLLGNLIFPDPTWGRAMFFICPIVWLAVFSFRNA